ncbi:MAG: TetR/AcrR family transcriptional regulator [Desulfobacterota bacterium]|nr:TetR/AcrR family transcriptional regulator [Thermodesulfobacteriota bacterium]
MKEEKRQAILDAAIKAFAKKGYQYATIEEIAKEAGVAKGLVHVYFENKLDLLLSVILLFIETVNQKNRERLAGRTDPVDRLRGVFETFAELLSQSQKNLYWGHILREGLPQSEIMKSKRQRQKLAQIYQQSSLLQETIDSIIRDGQQKGRIDPSLQPQIIRQILGGASQVMYYGLALERHRKQPAGYTEQDVQRAISFLIDKFTCSLGGRRTGKRYDPRAKKG